MLKQKAMEQEGTNKRQSQRPMLVFLCHSSDDKPIIRDLYYRLKNDGIKPWLDEEDILPGQAWEREIPNAVRASDVVIVCLSKGATTKTGYIQKEIKYALDIADEQPEGAIFIIPLKLEECDIPDRLRRWQWVNYYDQSGYDRLLQSLSLKNQSRNSMLVVPEQKSQATQSHSEERGGRRPLSTEKAKIVISPLEDPKVAESPRRKKTSKPITSGSSRGKTRLSDPLIAARHPEKSSSAPNSLPLFEIKKPPNRSLAIKLEAKAFLVGSAMFPLLGSLLGGIVGWRFNQWFFASEGFLTGTLKFTACLIAALIGATTGGIFIFILKDVLDDDQEGIRTVPPNVVQPFFQMFALIGGTLGAIVGIEIARWLLVSIDTMIVLAVIGAFAFGLVEAVIGGVLSATMYGKHNDIRVNRYTRWLAFIGSLWGIAMGWVIGRRLFGSNFAGGAVALVFAPICALAESYLGFALGKSVAVDHPGGRYALFGFIGLTIGALLGWVLLRWWFSDGIAEFLSIAIFAHVGWIIGTVFETAEEA